MEEKLEYVKREMTSPECGFYSAQDADSEGVEGKFFIWLPQEIVEALGDEDGEVICRYFGVTPQGNFEGTQHTPRCDGCGESCARGGHGCRPIRRNA